MANKDTKQLLERARKQGAVITHRGKGLLVQGPLGSRTIHVTMNGGPKGVHKQRRELRAIGFDV